jgi:hypothetical protein
MNAAAVPPDAPGADPRFSPAPAWPLTPGADDDPYAWVGYESAWALAAAADDPLAGPRAGAQ